MPARKHFWEQRAQQTFPVPYGTVEVDVYDVVSRELHAANGGILQPGWTMSLVDSVRRANSRSIPKITPKWHSVHKTTGESLLLFYLFKTPAPWRKDSHLSKEELRLQNVLRDFGGLHPGRGLVVSLCQSQLQKP